MKKLLLLALFAASMQAMEKMDLHTSAELIKSLVEGELNVEGNEISAPAGQRYTLDAFHEGLKDHGVIIDGEQMIINPTTVTNYGQNLASFFTNADLENLLDQGAALDQDTLDTIEMRRRQLLTGLIMKDSLALMYGLQGPLHINPDSLQ